MSGAGGRRLAWEGREARELVRQAWPITISMVSYSVMTLTDTVLVGHLGAAALAGVGLGGTLAFVGLCFSFGLLRGAKTLVSQARGAGRHDQVLDHQRAASVMAATLGLITAVIGQAAALVVGRLAKDPAAAQAASTYLSIRLLAAPMVMVYVAVREVRYGLGDSRSPMVATVTANLVNVGLALVFIRGFGWGVAGAAWATVVAHTVELLVLAGLVGRAALGLGAAGAALPNVGQLWAQIRALGANLRALLVVGLPVGVQFMLEVGSFALAASLIARMGVFEMAAHQIAIQVIHFSFLPALAVSEAASVLAGEAVGAEQPRRVLRVAHVAIALTSVYTLLWTLVMALGAPWLASAFTADAKVVAVAVSLLHIAAIFQIFDGANVIARGILRGTGDVKFAAWVGVATAWAATPPLTWGLGMLAGLGARGAWWGITAETVVGALILWWRLERGGWETARLAQKSLPPTPGASAAEAPTPAIVAQVAEG
jgi:MATE family multidrug resistance protein